MRRFTVVLTISLVLCGAAAALATFPLTVSDALGRTVTLAHQPQRIISLAPSITEILFALGLDDRIAGISDADDYPPDRIKGKPRIGGVQVNVEMLVGLRPDLILGMLSLQRGQLERLVALRLPVVAVDARSLPDVYAQVTLIGRLTGREDAARRLTAQMQTEAQAVSSAVRGSRPPRVYVEIWGDPPTAAGGDTFVDDLLRRAGGRNIFSDVAGWPQVAGETVIALNPEVIILTYAGRSQVLQRPGWADVAGVRSHRVVEVPSALVSRPGPRLILGLERLARVLHPEAFH